MSIDRTLIYNRFSNDDVTDAEARRNFVRLTPDEGQLTINAGTVTLVDEAGATVGGIADDPVTGYDSGAQDAPRAWYKLDTTDIEPGIYTLLYKIDVTDSALATSTAVRRVRVIVE